MYNYGYDTFKAYQREDHSEALSIRLKQEYKPNKGYEYIHNNAKIHLSFPNGMTTVSFSIPKLLFSGCNIELAGINEALEAIGLMSEILGVDFSQFETSRLDIATNIASSVKAEAYLKHLKKPPYFKGYTLKRKGVYYHTATELRDSGRVLVLYNKEDLIRIETRLFSKRGKSAKKLIKSHLKHEALVSELMKESFYVNSIYYLNDLVLSAIPKGKMEMGSKIILDELKASLESNLHYTLPSQFLRNVC